MKATDFTVEGVQWARGGRGCWCPAGFTLGSYTDCPCGPTRWRWWHVTHTVTESYVVSCLLYDVFRFKDTIYMYILSWMSCKALDKYHIFFIFTVMCNWGVEQYTSKLFRFTSSNRKQNKVHSRFVTYWEFYGGSKLAVIRSQAGTFNCTLSRFLIVKDSKSKQGNCIRGNLGGVGYWWGGLKKREAQYIMALVRGKSNRTGKEEISMVEPRCSKRKVDTQTKSGNSCFI